MNCHDLEFETSIQLQKLKDSIRAVDAGVDDTRNEIRRLRVQLAHAEHLIEKQAFQLNMLRNRATCPPKRPSKTVNKPTQWS